MYRRLTGKPSTRWSAGRVLKQAAVGFTAVSVLGWWWDRRKENAARALAPKKDDSGARTTS